VELADIMPTLLERVGIEVPKQVQGESLRELMKTGPEGDAAAEAWRDRGAYSQADYGHLAFAWSAIQSLRTGKYLYVQAPRRELYDEGVDANAEYDLAPASRAVADTLSARLEAFRQKTTNSQETPKATLDEARAKKLAALGYVVSRSDASLSVSADKGADPKDKIAVANTILRVNGILEDFRCDKAIPELQKALLTAGDVSMLHFFLGGCYAEKDDYEKAAPELRKAVQLDPGFTHAELNLARALLKIKDYEGAATAFEHVAQTEPQIMDAHVFLVIIYAKLNRVPEEIKACRTVLKSLPDDFGSNLNLGRFLAQSGDLEGAIAPLQKAASVRPNGPVAHRYLADVYSRLGREDDAKREQAEAERLTARRVGPPEGAPDAEKSEHN
jgi:tetratricopeptide (TPR) repeat protein